LPDDLAGFIVESQNGSNRSGTRLVRDRDRVAVLGLQIDQGQRRQRSRQYFSIAGFPRNVSPLQAHCKAASAAYISETFSDLPR
jgi:hypothetical protein